VASKAIPGLLQLVWDEMDYRLEACHVTQCRHIQHLRGMQRKLSEFLYPYVDRILQSFLLFKCTNFMKCVHIIYHLYQYCHILFYILRGYQLYIYENFIQHSSAKINTIYRFNHWRTSSWISHNRSTNNHISLIPQILGKKYNKMRQCISYLCTSRKPMIQLGGRSCIIFSLSLVLYNILIEFGPV
jgi:hypothetical protein